MKAKLLILFFCIATFTSIAQQDFTLLPKNSSVFNDTSITFTWNNLGANYSYQLLVSTDSLFSEITLDVTTDSTIVDTNLFSLDKKYFWKVIGTKSFESVVSNTLSILVTSLTSFENINLWLSASDGIVMDADSNIQYWQNLVNISDSAYQANVSKQPKFIQNDTVLNNQPVVSFDGSNDELINPNYHKLGAMFVVARWNGDELTFPKYNGLIEKYSSADYTYVFLANRGTSSFFASSTPWGNNGFYINQNQTKDFAPLSQYKVLLGQTDSPADYNDLLIGKSNANNAFWKGEIAEVIAFDSIPSDSIKNIVYSYLQNKYSPPVNLGENISINYGFADTIISAFKPWFASYKWYNKGDSISADSAIPINQSGTYHVSVTDIFGFQSTDSIKVTFNVHPQQISDTTICLNDTLTWHPNLLGPYYYEYNYPEGSGRAYATTETLNITQPGDYWLVITDTNGYSWYSDTITVQVNNFPAGVSLGNDTTLCQYNRIYLQNGYEQAETYNWSTGASTEYIELLEAGTYSVTVTDTMGCVGMDSATFEMEGIAPTPDFTYTNHCLGDEMEFTDASSSPDGSTITNWEWKLNNETINENSNFKFQISKSGSYNVVLEVGNELGCTNSIRKDVTIYNTPEARFMPKVACSNTETHFFESSVSSDGEISKFLWGFPGDISDTAQHATFTFTETGTNSVRLIVETEHGCKDTATQSLEVREGPKVDFTYTAGCVDRPVYFTDKSESFLSSPLRYKWTFDNSKHAYVNNPEYVFSDTGTYQVMLEVNQDFNNCKSSLSKTVQVFENPTAAFSGDDFCEQLTGQLNSTSRSPNKNIATYHWNIAKQGKFSEPQLSLSWDSAGSYTVQHWILDEAGCRDTIADTISVHPLPVVYFETSVDKGPVPLSVDFYNQSEGNIIAYDWDFGDGSRSNDLFPSHSFADSGTYTVSLLATSNQGCYDTYSRKIRAIIPRIDISTSAVKAEDNNGFMKVWITIQNLGTTDLDTIEFYYKANYGQTIKEVLTETVKSGATYTHYFSTEMEVKSNVELTHVCAWALPHNKKDELPDDNEACMAFESAFKTMNPYPNPVNDELVIEYIIPFDAEVNITFFNQYGKLTRKTFDGMSLAGFNRHVIDVRTFAKGTYYYRIEYEGNVKTYQVIIK